MLLPEQAVILLVEDREDDVLLVRRAFERAGVTNALYVARDGEEAISYLEGTGKYAKRDEYPIPDIMLLDIKMPKVDGFEVLKFVRSRAEFKGLRVILLTSSEEISEVNRGYELGANSFLVKPLEFENYAAMMRTLSSFWLHHSSNPGVSRPPQTGKKER